MVMNNEEGPSGILRVAVGVYGAGRASPLGNGRKPGYKMKDPDLGMDMRGQFRFTTGFR